MGNYFVAFYKLCTEDFDLYFVGHFLDLIIDFTEAII
jgi:hypothetical protein